MKRLPPACCVLLVVTGCGRSGSGIDARPAAAPLVGHTDAAGATDVADHECHVVLRRAEHLVDARGQGVLATVDVDEQFLQYPGQTPGVLFRADGGDWRSVTATPADGAPAGYARFVARFLAWQSADFIAFDPTSTDLRLFDHNRLPGDFDSFHVDASNGFAVPEAPSVCPGLPPRATLEFEAGYSEAQHGAIVAGGELEIDYDLSRLTACRDTHDGYRFWTLDAYARFASGGQLVSGSVVGSNGAESFPIPFVADVPPDATSVQLWFRNASPPSCEAWDSRYGRNYTFDVVPAPAPAAAPPPTPGSTTSAASAQRALPPAAPRRAAPEPRRPERRARFAALLQRRPHLDVPRRRRAAHHPARLRPAGALTALRARGRSSCRS